MVAGRGRGGVPGPAAQPATPARNAGRAGGGTGRVGGGTSIIPGAAIPEPPPSPTVSSPPANANAAAAALAAAARAAVAASSAQNNQDGGIPQDGDDAGLGPASQSSDAAIMSNAVTTNYSRRFATTLKKAGLAPSFDEYNQSDVSLDSICIVVLL